MVLLDIEMPKSCKDCRINVYGRCGALRTSVLQEMVNEERNDNCPIKAEIPKNATNGDVIKAMFPRNNMLVNESLGEKGTVFFESEDNVIIYSLDWWNAPWKGQENDSSNL